MGGLQGLNMKAILIGKTVAPALLVGTASIAALVYGLTQTPHGGNPGTGAVGVMTQPPQPESGSKSEPKSGPKNGPASSSTAANSAAKTATAESAASGNAGSIKTEPPSALASTETKAAATETKTAALANELAAAPPAPTADPSVPAFDLARVEAGGDAVIAGRAAPGATVDLMRNGERLDRAVADASGQFVMVPPRLPAGSYELTLSAKLADGTVTQSKQGVAVSIKEAEATASLPAPTAPQARAPAAPAAPVMAKQDTTAALPRQALASTSASASDDSPSAGSTARNPTRVVVRGDSLWRISRITYGAGEQYAIVYQANRDRIRNPNLIHPGQVLVLPVKRR
jgi:LysM repeat protein